MSFTKMNIPADISGSVTESILANEMTDIRQSAIERAMMVQEEFHSHLDKCSQCRNHPMNLCPAGATILMKLNFPVSDK